MAKQIDVQLRWKNLSADEKIALAVATETSYNYICQVMNGHKIPAKRRFWKDVAEYLETDVDRLKLPEPKV